MVALNSTSGSGTTGSSLFSRIPGVAVAAVGGAGVGAHGSGGSRGCAANILQAPSVASKNVRHASRTLNF